MARYPKAAWRPIPENNTQSRINPRALILHTAVSNGSSLYGFWTSSGSAGVESHFYLQKDGDFEQYLDTTRRADCQRDGNSFGVSVETWDGYGAVWTRDADLPAWTTAQCNALVDLMVWMHRTHGLPLRVSRYWNDSGVAWHNKYIGSPGFAAGPRTCPGARRIRQIPSLIERAKRVVAGGGAEEDEMSAAEVNKIIDAIEKLGTRVDKLEGRVDERVGGLGQRIEEMPAEIWAFVLAHPNGTDRAAAETFLTHGRADAWSAPATLRALRDFLVAFESQADLAEAQRGALQSQIEAVDARIEQLTDDSEETPS